MPLAARLLGLVPRFQAARRCKYQATAFLGASHEAAALLQGVRGSVSQAGQVERKNRSEAPGGEFWNRWMYQPGAAVKGIEPQGSFKGPREEEFRDPPDEGYVVHFGLKSDVPFETVLVLDAATQGLCNFEGHRLRGTFWYPDVRVMSKGVSGPSHQPWPTFAKVLLRYPLVHFSIVAETEDDAKDLEAAVQPYASFVDIYDQKNEEPVVLC